MYWEEFWEYTTMAANFSSEEKNAELRFQFSLHADRKSIHKWKALPVPFPPIISEREKELSDKSGISQLPGVYRGLVYRPDEKR